MSPFLRESFAGLLREIPFLLFLSLLPCGVLLITEPIETAMPKIGAVMIVMGAFMVISTSVAMLLKLARLLMRR